MDTRDFMRIGEIAHHLNLSLKHVYGLVQAGRLGPVQRLGTMIFVPRQAVTNWHPIPGKKRGRKPKTATTNGYSSCHEKN